MPAQQPRRRTLTRLCLALVLGAVTNILLAGALAYRCRYLDQAPRERGGERICDARGNTLPWPDNGKEPPNSQFFELSLYDGPGVTFGFSRLRPFQNFTPAAPYPRQPSPESVATRWERAILLPWVDGSRPWPDPTKGDSVWVKASGWPLRCFASFPAARNSVVTTGGTTNITGHTWSAPGGIIIGSANAASWADWPPAFPILLPYQPLWPELLANTALFSLAWCLLLGAPGAARRWLRTRRGQCPACGYDLKGSPQGAPCPECGTATPGSQRNETQA